LHTTSGYTNCYTGNLFNATVCSSGTACASGCALDGADYSGTYGIASSGNAVTLKFVTTGGSNTNVGSRIYLMETDTSYKLFKLLNKEFTFDVDVSNLPCGLNGALYFSQMDADGGMSKFPTNKAGAKYGTGYCDSQCPRDLKFINGVANSDGWKADSNSANSGTGTYGSCCNEMDIWEANSVSAAYTPHPCKSAGGQTRCTGTECGATSSSRYGGFCDPDGCDFNSYRQGDATFYGKGLTVDTSSKFTVVTQFITADGTDTGTLSEIKRFYVQNGKTIPNSSSKVSGVTGNSITEAYCTAQKSVFGDTNEFASQGGLKTIGQGFGTGVVLVLSVWDDYSANMLWLDSTYPTTKTAADPGAARGTCATTSGKPQDLEKNNANASVTYSNIKFGPIGSTFSSGGTGSPSGTATSATSTSTSGTGVGSVAHYGQCGGSTYSGPTACVSPYTCTALNAFYSQCL